MDCLDFRHYGKKVAFSSETEIIAYNHRPVRHGNSSRSGFNLGSSNKDKYYSGEFSEMFKVSNENVTLRFLIFLYLNPPILNFSDLNFPNLHSTLIYVILHSPIHETINSTCCIQFIRRLTKHILLGT